MRLPLLAAPALLGLLLACSGSGSQDGPPPPPARALHVYVGTGEVGRTPVPPGALQAYALDAERGALQPLPLGDVAGALAGMKGASGIQDLAFSKDGTRAYLSTGTGTDGQSGLLACRRDPGSGSLSVLAEDPARPWHRNAAGSGPVVVDPLDRAAYVMGTYFGGFSAFGLDGDGRPTPMKADDPQSFDPTVFSTGTDLISPAIHPGGRFLYLGGRIVSEESLRVYTLDGSGRPGASPRVLPGWSLLRQVLLDPPGRYLYALQGTPSGGSEIAAFRVDGESGALSRVPAEAGGAQSLSVPEGASQILIHPTGRYLYLLVAGLIGDTRHPALWTLGVDPNTGALHFLGGPRPLEGEASTMAMDPEGRVVVVTALDRFTWTGLVLPFRVSAETGTLAPMEALRLPGQVPGCVAVR